MKLKHNPFITRVPTNITTHDSASYTPIQTVFNAVPSMLLEGI